MSDILRLDHFMLTRLQINWVDPDPGREGTPLPPPVCGYDYEAFRNNDNPRQFALKFLLSASPDASRRAGGYSIESEIVGFFTFPESMPENDMQYLVRVNGCTILYGVLRGQLSAFTGVFPGGQFILPAVDMREVVQQIDLNREAGKEKTAAKKKAATAKKAAGGKSARGKKKPD